MTGWRLLVINHSGWFNNGSSSCRGGTLYITMVHVTVLLNRDIPTLMNTKCLPDETWVWICRTVDYG